MNLGIRGGHTKASGGAVSILNEVTEDRIIYPKVIDLAKKMGNNVIDLTPPESYSYPAELQFGINLANRSNLDMGASIHLNAGGGHGVEVVIHDQAKQSTVDAANRVLNNMAALGFYNRGIKRSPSMRYLGEIVNTTCSFMIIEVCFVDSQTDADILHKVGYDEVAKAITEGITGQKLATQSVQNIPLAAAPSPVQTTQTNTNQGGFRDMNMQYKNGSTPEICYADSNLTVKVGSLDPWETCTQIGVQDGKPIVLYNTAAGKKVAFVRYNPNKTY